MARIEYGHPLYGAELRLARARRLIGTMHRQYQRWADEHEHSGFHQRPNPRTGRVDLSPVIPDSRHIYVPRIAITVGEAAYNIRASLDYLVQSIARARNRGRLVRGNQFPLAGSEDDYWMRWTGKHPTTGKQVRKWLKHIPKDVACDLAHYQPFAKCPWAQILDEISNLDKHNQLIPLDISATFVPDRPALGVIDTEHNRQTLHLRGKVEVGVTLESGKDVIEATKLVESEARALIRSYAGRFKLGPTRFV